jgi:hypothetical protein
MSEKDMTETDIRNWKLELANAVLAEAEFNNCPIEVGADIEHQLGTVWVGDAAITFVKTESLDD